MFLKNSFSVVGARAIDVVSSFALIVIVSRYLSVKEYGEYAFIMSYVIFLTPIAYGGIERIAIHEMCSKKDDLQRYLGTLLVSITFQSLIFIAICIFGLIFINPSSLLLSAIILVVIGQITFSLSSVYLAMFRAIERMELDVLLSIAYQMALATATVVTIKLDLGFIGIFGAFALSNIFRTLFAWFLSNRLKIRSMLKADFSTMKPLLKKSYSLGVYLMLFQAILNVDVLMLKISKGAENVSFFYAAHNLLWKFNKTVPAALAVAVFPIMSILAKDHLSSQFKDAYRLFLKLFYIVVLFIAVWAYVFSSDIIKIVYGEKFLPSSPAFQILLLGEVFIFLFMFLELVVISIEKQHLLIKVTAIGLAVKLLLNFTLIPGYGYLGAAIATTSCYALLTSVMLYSISLSVGRISIIDILKPVFAVGGSLLFYHFSTLHYAVALLVGGLIYICMLIILKSISMDDAYYFKTGFKTVRPLVKE